MNESTLNSNQDKITVALHEVVDPEVGVNIVDLGLVYNIQVQERRIDVRMTMTTPACPLHSSISTEIETVIRRHLPEITDVCVELVWDPPWHPDRMSERAKRQLGWFGR
jgi:metal-sulfur cluster biosynthetic enzyme